MRRTGARSPNRSTRRPLILLRPVPRETPVHRLWAGTKLLAASALAVTVAFVPSWTGLLVLAVVLATAITVARIPRGAVPTVPWWVFASLGFFAVLSSVGSACESTETSGARTSSTRYGDITTPRLATAPTTIAICSGVAVTSYCPIDACAVCGSFMSAGNRLSAEVMGVSTVELKPKRSACSCIASAPSSMPIAPKVVLHERCSATSSVVTSLPAVHCAPS